jgi:hypothetical protein
MRPVGQHGGDAALGTFRRHRDRFAAMKERLEQDLKESAHYKSDACLNYGLCWIAAVTYAWCARPRSLEIPVRIRVLRPHHCAENYSQTTSEDAYH